MSVAEKQRAARAQQESRARQQEFMSLASGVGIIPEEFRNLGYRKLDFGPGEGGIRASRPAVAVAQSASAADMGIMLAAAIEAGADPVKLAGVLNPAAPAAKPGRARRGVQPTNDEGAAQTDAQEVIV